MAKYLQIKHNPGLEMLHNSKGERERLMIERSDEPREIVCVRALSMTFDS